MAYTWTENIVKGGKPVEANLVGWWSFNDGSGTNAIDNSGNLNDGTLVNTPSWVDGVSSWAVEFDGGSDRYVNIGTGVADFTTEDFSVSVWLAPGTGQASNTRCINKGTYNSSGWEIMIGGGSATLRTYQSPGFQANGGTFVDDGTWKHFVMVRDGVNVTWYVNGADATGSTENVVDIVSANQELLVGIYSNKTGYEFAGKVDELRIYDKVLSQSEVTALYTYPGGTVDSIEDTQIQEIRTNINTERVDRASLAAYVWTDATIDGQEILSSEVAELRTAIDAAYDELAECVAHYSSDDAAHYTTDKSTHDAAAEATHYATDEADHDTTHYTTHDAGALATHYTTDESAHFGTHNAVQNTGKKSSYCPGVKAYNISAK